MWILLPLNGLYKQHRILKQVLLEKHRVGEFYVVSDDYLVFNRYITQQSIITIIVWRLIVLWF